jgi:preprotein translocase subunit SecG
MLYYVLLTIYILGCLLLLLVVLLQQGKGGDIAAAFGGGGSQTAFGARAGATVLTKATAVLGAFFMVGSVTLGLIGRGGPSTLMRGVPAQQSPIVPQPGPADPGGQALPRAPVENEAAPAQQPEQTPNQPPR